ncbi:MAG: RNA repair transcriptional activator RtcR [Sandaracinaceae bacterium]
MAKRTVAIGLVGSTLDAGKGGKRWARWRPTVALATQPTRPLDRLELLVQPHCAVLADLLVSDLAVAAPETEVRLNPIELEDAWDFEEVYGVLHDFARGYRFKPRNEEYVVHITTGTHVAQICLFLLTEARYFPARLIQTSPPPRRSQDTVGTHRVIDLDLSRYDQLARRFAEERLEGQSFLKQGIDTRNTAFNALIDEIETVAIASRDPILLTGPTGAGKSQLATRIYELKHRRGQVEGPFVAVNCATLRGDQAMSALFGHVKGAYTGAERAREGLLRSANEGVLFLDEIGELGLDEQAMLLRAIELKRFLPVGADKEVSSKFTLFAGTNRDLRAAAAEGRFREDLLARIDLWTFELPGLAARTEDIEPNLDFELDRVSDRIGRRISLNREARSRFLAFAERAAWRGNFRDLNAAVVRMGTLAKGGRIDSMGVEGEVRRLQRSWSGGGTGTAPGNRVQRILGREAAEALDRFERVQLEDVLQVCSVSRSMSEAGRTLFSESRKRKKSSNDADRLRKYLARFGLSFEAAQG